MKREIKFRAKAVSSGEWVYGNFIHSKRFAGCGNQYRIHNQETGLESDIDIETIGQFTGLRDRGGVEIYEGDIVCWRGASGVEDGCGAVRYEVSCSQLVVDLIDNDDYEFFENVSYANIALIGNIHE